MKIINICLRLLLIHLLVVSAYAQNPVVMQGVITGTSTIKNVQVDSNGAIVLSGTITGGNGAASNTGAVVPAQASYTGAKVGANLVGVTGTVVGGSTGLDVNIVGGAAAGGTSSAFGAATPANGTATGLSDGTNMQSPRVFDEDSGAGTQYVQGVTLRISGNGGSTEVGSSSAPIRTDPTGTTSQPVTQVTAANLNATVVGTGTFATQSILTTGSAQIGHLEANQSVNEAQINGVAPLMGNGASGTGAQRVTIANDSTGIIALTTGSAQIGHLEANQSVNIAQMNGVATTMGNGVSGTGVQRVTIASDSTGSITAISGTAANLKAQVSAASGGFVAGALADGADTTFGTTTDAKSTATDATSITGMQVWKEISAQDQIIGGSITSSRMAVNLISGQSGIAGGTGVDGATVPRFTLATNVPLPAGTNALGSLTAGTALIGKVGIDQTTPGTTNKVSITDSSGGTIGAVTDPCDGILSTTVPISQTTSTKVISATSAKKSYICKIVIVAGAAEIVNVVEGTGSVCGTSTAALAGSTTAANGLSFAANGGFSATPGGTAISGIGTNVDVCLTQSGSNRVAGWLTYVQQ